MPKGRRLRVVGAVLSAAVTVSVLAPTVAMGAVPGRASAAAVADAGTSEARTAPTEEEALAQAKRSGEPVEVLSLRGVRARAH
ncbi:MULTISPECIES: hypothetical protein [Streptomyces]|uniref:hypothetical protein n=1 Tax=Streptomyces TaxID=1883 RepID=UPI0019CF60ED|nr:MULTISPECIES: hypothetical protein [Streptomyces]